jgi:hypothetical protein
MMTPEEIWLFTSVHIFFMGIVALPYLHMYWEGSCRQPLVVDAFSRGRGRFREILCYFLFSRAHHPPEILSPSMRDCVGLP